MRFLSCVCVSSNDGVVQWKFKKDRQFQIGFSSGPKGIADTNFTSKYSNKIFFSIKIYILKR